MIKLQPKIYDYIYVNCSYFVHSIKKELYSFLEYIFLALYKDIYGINLAIVHAVLLLLRAMNVVVWLVKCRYVCVSLHGLLYTRCASIYKHITSPTYLKTPFCIVIFYM
jgi:hypothetical protein